MTPTVMKPSVEFVRSMTAPAIGAPTAAPVVIAALCQPRISPRRSAGVSPVTVSAEHVRDGAQHRPAGNRVRHSHCQPDASHTGIVNNESSATNVVGRTGRVNRPNTNPPTPEPKHQMAMTSPAHCN
jgi:hypothetical protein